MNYYISPTGKDSNPGTEVLPFKTLGKISELTLSAGDTVYIRGGVYATTHGNSAWTHLYFQNIKGNASSPIVITAYPGEQPVFDLSNIKPAVSDPTALVIENCNYIHVKGIRITGLKQITTGAGVSRGIDLRNVTNSKFEQIELDHIGGYGFILSNGTNDNLFLNCDAHHMDDRYTTDGGAWGNANGFQCTGGSSATRNTFDGCRAWWISDDGFDLYSTNGIVTFKNCWAFWNGYEPGTFTKRGDGSGFKLGPMNSPLHNTITRTLIRCFAFENASAGFNQNNGDTRYQVYNCTSFNNPDYGFMWDYVSPAPTQDFKNNLSFQDGTARRGAETNGVTNSWNITPAPSNSYFQSLSSVGADGPRKADGSLPDITLMHLKPTCPYIDAGTIIPGVTYFGLKPDIGAFESGSVIPPVPEPTSFAITGTFVTVVQATVGWTANVTENTKAFIIEKKVRNKWQKLKEISPLVGENEYKIGLKLEPGQVLTLRLNVVDIVGEPRYSDPFVLSYDNPNKNSIL